MKLVDDVIQLWEVKPDIYGVYNRYVIGYSDKYGTVEGCMQEKDCGLPIGFHSYTNVKVKLAVFSYGKVLISAVG